MINFVKLNQEHRTILNIDLIFLSFLIICILFLKFLINLDIINL